MDEHGCTKCLTEMDQPLIREKIHLIAPYIPHDFFLQAERGDCCFFDHKVHQIEGCILYTDISGFTPLVSSFSVKGHAGNEQLQGILAGYYTELIGAINSFGGSVYQFAGDSILAGFSLLPDESSADNLQRTLSAVNQLSRSLIRFESMQIGAEIISLRSSIGIAYGKFNQIIIGSKELWCSPVYTGDPITRAIDAEREADNSEILVHAVTAAILPDQFSEKPGCDDFRKFIPSQHHTVTGNGQTPSATFSNPRLYKRCSYLIKPLLFERVIGGFDGFKAEHREVTCLLLKFDGIDYQADINAAAEHLNDFFEFVQKESSRYGGVLLQTDLSDKGNVFFILFGALRAQENKEILAVDLALNITQEIKRFPALQRIQAGVATGPAYCGDIGAPFRKDYTVVGPVINLASRLMTCLESTGVTIDAATESKTTYNFIKSKAEILTVKGFTSPVSAYRVTGRIKRYRGRTITYKDKMIGRVEEHRFLLERIKHNLSGKGGVTAITGEAGIGKTRLVDALLDELKHTGGEPSIGRCYPYEQTTVFYPWRELLNLIFQLFEYHSSETKISIITAALQQIYGAGYSQQLETITGLLGISYKTGTDAHESDPVQRQDFLFSTIETILRHSAEKSPLVLVFEDIHWIDEKSLRLLEYIANRIETQAISIILTSRPESSCGNLTSLSNFNLLHLPQLTDDEARDFIRSVLALHRQDSALETHILSSSGKNPFFIESIIHNMHDVGMIIVKGSERRFTGSLEDIAAPRTIHDLVLTRIDSLSMNEQIIIKTSSVIGRVFSFDALKILLPDIISNDECNTALDKFCSMEIIVRLSDNPPVFSFRHIAVCDVLYNTLLQTTREQLHQILAFYFERKHKNSPHENVEKLAYHFINARDKDQGIHYTILAAKKARDLYANKNAAELYRKAMNLIIHDNSASMHSVLFTIKKDLADVLRLAGNYEEAELLYSDCLAQCEDDMIKADILIGLGSVYQETARPFDAIRDMEKALRLLHRRPPESKIYTYSKLFKQVCLLNILNIIPALDRPNPLNRLVLEKQVQLLSVISKIYFLQNADKVAWAALTMYNTARRLKNEYLISLASGDVAMTLAGMGRIPQSSFYFEKSYTLAIKCRQPLAEAVALSRKGFYALFTGHPADAALLFSQSVDIFKKTGEKWEFFSALGGLGQSHFAMSDFIRSEKLYRELGDAALDVKNPLHAGWMYTRVSYCRYLTGMIDGDLTKILIHIGIEISRKAHDDMNLYRSYGHLATIAVHEKNAEDAAECALRIWEADQNYTIIMPHTKMTLMYACEAALFALQNGTDTRSRLSLLRIVRRSIKNLTVLSKKFSQLEGPALLSKARYYAYKKAGNKAEKYFTAALAVLDTSPDIWLAACAYRDAALAIPAKKDEYLNRSYSLFTGCSAVVDAQKVREIQENRPY